MKNKALNLNYKLLIILSILSILPACSSSDDDDDASNSAPSVSAGEDQTVNQGATVDLVGVASDSDGSISSWLWKQTSGSHSVTIKNSTTSNAYFSAPTVDTETTLVFELEVKDNDGASVSDSMRVTVRGPDDSVNPLPDNFEAVAGDGQVTLTWSHHSDASTDYNIYRSSASDCELANYTSCTDGDLFTSKSSGFVDDDLTNGTTYYYWIEAILDGVTYLDANSISATPKLDDDDNIDLTDGLVAHYEFDGDASDSSGNGNDGEEYGGVSYSNGVVGNALKITNEGDRVEIDNSELTRLDGNNKTISVFFEAQYLFTEYNQILDKTAGSDYALNVTSEGILRLSVHNGSEYELITTEVEFFQFYHATILRNGSSVALYLDGSLISEINVPDIRTTNNPLMIGAGGTPYGSGYSFNGIIDDLRIYDRALSIEEIQALYELGQANIDLSDGLIAHYEFEGDVDDSSGNENDGEEYGGVSYANGVIGKAASFDGIDDWLEPVDSTDYENGFTHTFWSKLRGDSSLSSRMYQTSGYDNRWQLRVVDWQIYLNVGEFTSGEVNRNYLNHNFPSDEWSFVAFTFNPSGKVTLTLNDEVTSFTFSDEEISKFTNSDRSLMFGYSHTDNYHYLIDGEIDDLRIYSRTLSTAEIQTLYELGDD